MATRAAFRRHHLLIILLLCLLCALAAERVLAQGQPLPAFPGAQGYGALTPGGRGGRVIAVTSLADSGPGSLREALEASGPRIVIFRVGGVIRLAAPIAVTEPYLTLAGQTAPGDGIVVGGAGISISTHDVIVRGMRFRMGDELAGAAPEARSGLSIGGPDGAGEPARNVIVDHCSISWAPGENVAVALAEDVTIQWSIISESLTGGQPGGSGNALLVAESGRRVSAHHNLLAHNSARNPLIKGDTEVAFASNLVYNWGHGAIVFEDAAGSGPTRSVITGNYFKSGPGSLTDAAVLISKNTDRRSEIFVADNGGDGKVKADLPLLAASAPLVEPPVPVTSGPAARLEALVLAQAGARSPARDSIDARVVREARRGAGGFISSPAEVGGWEALAAWEGGAPPADSDGDGMPDSFEAANGLRPDDPADANGQAPSGYTWVEEYLNGIIPAASGSVLHLPLLSR
jgi:pectate lyase